MINPVQFGPNPTVPKGMMIVVKPDGGIVCCRPTDDYVNLPEGAKCWTDPETFKRICQELDAQGEKVHRIQ